MQKPGKRYPLLLYHRWLSLYRWPSFFIGLALFALWWPATSEQYPLVKPPQDTWALVGAIAAGVVFLFTVAAPYLSFVQCRPTHLRVQTPLFSLAVSYSRIKGIRPVDFNQMHSPRGMRWSRRHFLEPFFGMTAVGVDLYGFPMEERVIRSFLNAFMFPTDQPGFLFLVKDWMEFSRELETRRDAWRAQKSTSRRDQTFVPPSRT